MRFASARWTEASECCFHACDKQSCMHAGNNSTKQLLSRDISTVWKLTSLFVSAAVKPFIYSSSSQWLAAWSEMADWPSQLVRDGVLLQCLRVSALRNSKGPVRSGRKGGNRLLIVALCPGPSLTHANRHTRTVAHTFSFHVYPHTPTHMD